MKWEDIQKRANEAYKSLLKAYELLNELDNVPIENPPTEDFIERVDVDTPLRRILDAMYDVGDYTDKYRSGIINALHNMVEDVHDDA